MSTGENVVYDLSESHQGNIIACAALTWLISAVVVASRFYLRGNLMELLGPEDWVILAALFFSLAESIGFIIQAGLGLGKHFIAIPMEKYVTLLEASWFTIVFYTCSLNLSKISVVLLYLRTLTYDWTRKVLLGFMVIVTVTGTINLILDFTACIPLKAFWDPSVQATYCHSNEVYYSLVGLQIGTDFLIFLLPLPVVCICIVSIIRLVLLATIPVGPDYSYTGVDTIYWSLIEVNTAIVCASVMTLKPLFNRIFAASTRQTTGTPEDGAAGPVGHPQHPHIPLPTIGSRPSRKAPPPLQTRQSWLSAQLAKLDKSLQTVNETRAPADEEVNLRRPETATTPRSRSEMELPPWPPSREPAGRDRLSHNSSIITPVEQRADEGPLR
ncbi:hypothetical protein KVR01_013844 [Diaporthe batatas]|uniref:uncharacterized protein n=1 Tax=Diaporthe batatas TaxID=748121 RepID=UPI001D0559C6|nr:uncharacterized protein KVR01_013844 [Diaporthe batatas]KAG8156309.1 hypothetical protein KVR01_013844 [Diaporthe batatas]